MSVSPADFNTLADAATDAMGQIAAAVYEFS